MKPRRFRPASPHLHRLALPILIAVTLPLHAALPGAETLAELITGQFDTNRDTFIDQAEWAAGTGSGFQEMDGDGNQSLTGAELDALAEPIGKETGELAAQLVTVLIKKVLLTMDTDKDGTVSLQEYTGQARAIFAKLDADRNASVQPSELVELPRRLIGG